MYIKRCIILPAVYCRIFASKGVLIRAIWKVFEFTVYCSSLIEGQGWNQFFERLQRQSNCPPENRIALLSNFAAERPKDSRFFPYLAIENPFKWPGTSLRRN